MVQLVRLKGRGRAGTRHKAGRGRLGKWGPGSRTWIPPPELAGPSMVDREWFALGSVSNLFKPVMYGFSRVESFIQSIAQDFVALWRRNTHLAVVEAGPGPRMWTSTAGFSHGI